MLCRSNAITMSLPFRSAVVLGQAISRGRWVSSRCERYSISANNASNSRLACHMVTAPSTRCQRKPDSCLKRFVAMLQLKVYGGSPHVEQKLAELLSHRCCVTFNSDDPACA